MQLSKKVLRDVCQLKRALSPYHTLYVIVAVLNLDHLLSAVRIKERPVLPENLGKTTAQKLFMLYLVKIVGIKS